MRQERTCSSAERDRREAEFFSRGPWSSLPRGHVGIATFRTRLGKILEKKILEVLPDVINDIEYQIQCNQEELDRLGNPRPSTHDKRLYLAVIYDRLKKLVGAAKNGYYEQDNDFFQAKDDDTIGAAISDRRLRAVTKDITLGFVGVMEHMGHEKCSDIALINQRIRPGSGTQFQACGLPNPTVLSNEKMRNLAQHCYNSRGGLELPGLYNPLVVGDLFRIIYKPWSRIAKEYIKQVWEKCQVFLDTALHHIADQTCADALRLECIRPLMQAKYEALNDKLQEILQPFASTHAITYNPNYPNYTVDSGPPTLWSEKSGPESRKDALDRILDDMWRYYEVIICMITFALKTDLTLWYRYQFARSSTTLQR